MKLLLRVYSFYMCYFWRTKRVRSKEKKNVCLVSPIHIWMESYFMHASLPECLLKKEISCSYIGLLFSFMYLPEVRAGLRKGSLWKVWDISNKSTLLNVPRLWEARPRFPWSPGMWLGVRGQKKGTLLFPRPPPRGGANWLHGPRDFCVYLCLPPHRPGKNCAKVSSSAIMGFTRSRGKLWPSARSDFEGNGLEVFLPKKSGYT